MFTGIVEEIGVVAELNPHDETGGTSLTIALPASSALLSDCTLGDSIAINGVCLTVTSFTAASPAGPPRFTVGVAPETLRVTNLEALAAGSRVNLERAVRADTRMGGHFVQGHVDTTAEIAALTPDGNALTIRFRPRDQAALRYVVYKGFIALDGTSLTVTKVDDAEGWWEVMLIAYTQERVVIAGKKVGDTVNVEVDMMAKYAEKSMNAYLSSLELGTEAGAVPFIQKVVERIVAQGLGGKTT
ncbi:Riboflavin synthase [Pleurostoma richardsiae]|uniref:Riboflavin synthase n=1 Tax=Pleurostoma richardsiae TaxID=41990 RepID=A0AA38VLK5_9PEZI|nr:Riboflavin synthase [Pleurostoma richardsiae]